MRNSIEYSGGLNGEPGYSFQLVDVEHGNITVDGKHSSIRTEVTGAELRSLILSALFALESGRLWEAFYAGKITQGQHVDAIRKLDKEGPPMPKLASLRAAGLPGESQVKP